MKNIQIRPYYSKDKNQISSLFDLNTPKFFALSERDDLINYLKNERENYFVVEKEKNIIGAGGMNYIPNER